MLIEIGEPEPPFKTLSFTCYRMEVEFVGPKSNQIGMAPTEDTLRWIWEMKFSAVAGDTR